jgi:hypothetical protein
MKNNDMEMNTTTKTATLCIDASLLARLNFDAANCTVKEADLLNKIIEGMDHAGEGWFHELTATATPTHSERALLGSLIKKGLVHSQDKDGLSWVEIAD